MLIISALFEKELIESFLIDMLKMLCQERKVEYGTVSKLVIRGEIIMNMLQTRPTYAIHERITVKPNETDRR